MSATWHTLKICAESPNDVETFKQLSLKIGAIPAAKELKMKVEEKILTVQKGASQLLQLALHRTCREDPLIVYCSLRGPRMAWYQIKGGR
jgi:hypothetical protein